MKKVSAQFFNFNNVYPVKRNNWYIFDFKKRLFTKYLPDFKII